MTIIKISKHVLAQEVAGETVLLDLQGEKYFGLDAVGTRIWQLLNDGHGEHEVIDILLAEYDIEPETLKWDVRKLLDRLSAARLIEMD